jgi:hypothetical protein
MRLLLFPTLALALYAGALYADDPRQKPADYPVHAESARVDIAAEYLVHSFGNGHQMYLAPDFLVVDTAVYPHGALKIDPAQFALRIDGKYLIKPMAPQMVAYTVSQANPVNPRSPFPVQSSPDPDRQNGKPTPEAAGEVLVRMALQAGEFHSPQGGFLYFPFNGKLKKVKSMELVYSGDAGQLTLNLY